MALPPAPREQLRERSSHIVSVRVARVHRAVVDRDDREGWTDTSYCIEADILSVEKGLDGIDPGAPLYVHAWTARDRPGGAWTGPEGNRDLPDAGERVRLYLRRDERGRLHVLEPNGCEPL